MNLTDLLGLIAGGENSRVEFKRDDIPPERLASRLAGLLNLDGGHVLLGIEDDRSISGLSRAAVKAEEWVMQVASDHLQPSIIPTWEVVESENGVAVGIVTVPANAPDKPYKAKQGSHWVTKVRVGTTTRDATREEEQRLYQQSGGLRYGLKPVLGTDLDSLDYRRVRDYFARVLADVTVPEPGSEQWSLLLRNLEFVTEVSGHVYATVDGMLLFGRNNRRFVPQCGVRAVCYVGVEPDYATRADEDIKGALVPLGSMDGPLVETGLIERTIDFVRRNTEPTAHLERGRRIDRDAYPADVVRELVVNALVHRDYSIIGTDVMLSIFSDRLEIQSPGKLPNSISVDRLLAGSRYARNQTLMNVMRDYGYVDGRGMGIRLRVLPRMRAHNGSEPEFVEEQHRFTVRLRQQAP
ncbi:MAG: putative DNA binding domain-containing protein [Acidimicrobiaceae bacterium]|nr:putative DNA binding domain-containing protein [Acidimicrobiaceae bacterium]